MVNRAPSAPGAVPFQAAAQSVTIPGRCWSAGCAAKAVLPSAAETAAVQISAVTARGEASFMVMLFLGDGMSGG
ncbi:hypothetical protein ACFOSC_10595 [Streptantibioticus rubrisoli]|uniref:Alkaline phosphatase n=1 Tax=Streptantibioticus rubrisoli TaxID=1387313 RepID=A0ABT1PE62_9ACTN|nr:hypothetical protein [Streptantibioticus rubrisoli]MCQ4042753.1 hypothetical protein [Streptantibioticus rubrisoli]